MEFPPISLSLRPRLERTGFPRSVPLHGFSAKPVPDGSGRTARSPRPHPAVIRRLDAFQSFVVAPGDSFGQSRLTRPGSVGLEEHLRRPEIERPPPSPALAVVVARRPPRAAPTPSSGLGLGSHRHHHRLRCVVEVDVLDTVRVSPQARSHTLVFRTPPRLLVSGRQTARNLRSRRGALAISPQRRTHGCVRRAA